MNFFPLNGGVDVTVQCTLYNYVVIVDVAATDGSAGTAWLASL